MWSRILGTKNDIALTISRVVLGVVVFAHGAQKMLGWFGGRGFSGTISFYGHLGFSAPVSTLAMAVEFFGGLALILGFLGRIAAFGVLCRMIYAVVTLYWQFGFFMNWTGESRAEGYEYHLLAIALGLAILIRGSGALSVDWLYAKRQSSGPR